MTHLYDYAYNYMESKILIIFDIKILLNILDFSLGTQIISVSLVCLSFIRDNFKKILINNSIMTHI